MRSSLLAGTHASRCIDAAFEFPSSARAGRHAARLWFEVDTPLSLSEFGAQLFLEHCRGITDSPRDRATRRSAFRQAFVETVGQIVVEEGRFHALAA